MVVFPQQTIMADGGTFGSSVYAPEGKCLDSSIVHAKLDWYTVMLRDTTIDYIFSRFGIMDYYDETLASMYERSQGWTSKAVFHWNGIEVETDWGKVVQLSDEDLFNTVFSDIRLSISGTGLDYLREIGHNVEDLFTDPDFWECQFDVTRADFAFDFVDYKPEFFDSLLHYCTEQHFAGEDRVVCKSGPGKFQNRALKFGVNMKDGRTIYFGGRNSDVIIRIYDKLMQYVKNDRIVKPLPEVIKEYAADGIAPDSWFRIEMQFRREKAAQYLFESQGGDLSGVLRKYFDDYAIVDRKTMQPLDFILDFYDWASLPTIIQNANFV